MFEKIFALSVKFQVTIKYADRKIFSFLFGIHHPKSTSNRFIKRNVFKQEKLFVHGCQIITDIIEQSNFLLKVLLYEALSV